jgi:hypothetical protein
LKFWLIFFSLVAVPWAATFSFIFSSPLYIRVGKWYNIGVEREGRPLRVLPEEEFFQER